MQVLAPSDSTGGVQVLYLKSLQQVSGASAMHTSGGRQHVVHASTLNDIVATACLIPRIGRSLQNVKSQSLSHFSTSASTSICLVSLPVFVVA